MSPANPEGTEKTAIKERRFKLSRACDRCRRRRIKCDEGHPCQACLSASSDCTFEEPGKRTHIQKSKYVSGKARSVTLEDRMHQLETLIQAIPPAVFAAGQSGDDHHPAPYFSPDSTTSPLASFASSTHVYPPSGVPPPSLHNYPLSNPSSRFTGLSLPRARSNSHAQDVNYPSSAIDGLSEQVGRMSISASYLYFDDEGYTRWQGETSGLPLLDLLVDQHLLSAKPREDSEPLSPSSSNYNPQTNNATEGSPHLKTTTTDYFPNRTPKCQTVNPEMLWRLITTYIVPDLMDSLVQCYLSTSYYLIPFLHVPTFLSDYGNPAKWGEPGFAAFIVAMCCLASRHTDDPRVRSNPTEGTTAGTQWFDLFGRLRNLPISDRPTLYTIQADLVAAVYAVGLGRLSKAASLLSEAITVSIDAGLHRSADTYDLFDPIEDEMRKRTFWSVYTWDKLLGVHFGRPPMIRLRDCDVSEPAMIDDEFITRESLGTQPVGQESRMGAFLRYIRMMIVLESVMDVPPTTRDNESSSFLVRATAVLTGSNQTKELREEEALLDEILRSIPPYWEHSSETLASADVIRVTQAERLFCCGQFVRMLIHRHRFTNFVAQRSVYKTVGDETKTDEETQAVVQAHTCASQIIQAHLHVAAKGLMTYYGVHVIHQLTQAGRTLVAILLNCKTELLKSLITSSLEALRSCVGLLRRFSGRYVCGQRSGDLLEEFCRITQIPLDASRPDGADRDSNSRPPWMRPVRKKQPSSTARPMSQQSSPERFPNADYYSSSVLRPLPFLGTPSSSNNTMPQAGSTSNGPNPEASVDGTALNYPLGVHNGVNSAFNPSAVDDNNMYMSPDMLALFDGGNMDMSSLFSPGFGTLPINDGHDSLTNHAS